MKAPSPASWSAASSARTACCSLPSEKVRTNEKDGDWGRMFKKDLGLLILILVVGTAVALINPRFLSPINISNTANLVGLFGLFSLAQAFVIITGGIEL